MASVYAALVVRSHFLSLASSDVAHAGLMTSRAETCQLLAIKLLRYFASSKVELAVVLTTGWSPIAGAPSQVVDEIVRLLGGKGDLLDDPTSALEVAIATNSKAFLSSSMVQLVVNDIYAGRIVFSVASNRSLLADNYKPRAIEVYDVREAPFLDHYRQVGLAVVLLSSLDAFPDCECPSTVRYSSLSTLPSCCSRSYCACRVRVAAFGDLIPHP